MPVVIEAENGKLFTRGFERARAFLYREGTCEMSWNTAGHVLTIRPMEF